MPDIPADLQKQVEAAAPPELDLRFKPMFGGIGAYADGRMFMTLSDVGVALKLGGAEREALLKLRGAKPLRYAPDAPPSKSYVIVPQSVLADRALMRKWMAASASFVRSAPPRKMRRR